MENRLIILTRRFPFFKTEAFLESELPILADYFKEIVICPSETGSFQRQVPGNVHVELSFAKQYKKKAKRILLTFFSGYFWKLVFRYIILGKFKFFHIFQFSSRVLAYKDYFNKNKSIFDNSLVYSYWLNETPIAFIYSRKKLKLNSIIVSRAHRYDVYENGIDLLSFWPDRQNLLKHIDKVFVISENAKLYLDENYNSNQKTIVAKLGVFDNKTISETSKPGKYHIVSVSRIDPVKRLEIIMNCLDNFAQKLSYIEIKWTHFGTGKLYDDLLEKSQKVNSKNLKIELKGAVDNSMIYKFYKETPVDCFINLSSSEGIPVSIMEAQSFGIPAIATNVGGTSEIVTSETGILLTTNPGINEVTNALTTLYNEKPDRILIKESWNRNYNAEINYRNFAKELLKLTQGF